MAMERVHKKENGNAANRIAFSKRNFWSGFIFGIGLVSFFDEAVFHQILHWHHFYDKSSTAIGLVSDGLFHAFSWFTTIGGLFMLADLRRRNGLWLLKWWGGVGVGVGGFQLYDGTIQHKIMRIHQIRYVENVIVYDLVWNISAVMIIMIGLILIYWAQNKSR